MRLKSTQLLEAKQFVLDDHCSKAIVAGLTCDDNGASSYGGAVIVYNDDYGCISSAIHE